MHLIAGAVQTWGGRGLVARLVGLGLRTTGLRLIAEASQALLVSVVHGPSGLESFESGGASSPSPLESA